MEFIKELKKLGLNDKEASVYVACLTLGSSPVQNIAHKAKVVRATTYVILEALMQRGLVTHFKQGKKTLFSAEPPRQLLRLIEKQEEELKEQHHDLEKLLPELQMLMKSADEKPSVRYFEGKEGLHAMRQEIVMYCGPEDTIYSFTPTDYLNVVFPENTETFNLQRAAKKIKAKTIFTTKSEKLRDTLLNRTIKDFNERRWISPQYFPSTSGMTIYRDRIAIGTFAGKLNGVIIESQPMAEMMRRVFYLAWHGTERVDKA